MPKASVIIPTHNRARVVGEAIESVLAQTYADLEIIVVDDGSTDDTSAVVESYVARHPTHVTYLWQENAGAPAARNTGIGAATGEYVAFLDSDDLYLPRRLEVGIDVLEGNPPAGASYVDAQTVDAEGHVLIASRIAKFGGPASGWILPALLRGDLIQTNTITIRRDVLLEVGGFDNTLWSGQDTDLWWRLAKKWEIIAVPETLTIVRELESSLSRGVGTKTDRLKRLAIWIEGQAKYLARWDDLPARTRRLLARRIWDLRYEQECLLSELGDSSSRSEVQAHMRELQSQYGLRLHAMRRRLGRRFPWIQHSWQRHRESALASPVLESTSLEVTQ